MECLESFPKMLAKYTGMKYEEPFVFLGEDKEEKLNMLQFE